MKKLIAAATIMGMAMLTACGSGGAAANNADTTKAAAAAPSGDTAAAQTQGGGTTATGDHKIVMIIASGKLGDQAENDASWSGIQKYADEIGAECSAFELAELQDYDATARSFCDKGYDLVVMNTAQAADFVPAVAQDYPDVKFIIGEGTLETELDNILNVRFRVAEGGFINGAFAALMNKELTGVPETAFIGGMRNPNLDRSQFAFAAGAKYVGGNSTPVYVGSFTDAAKAKELAIQLYSGDVRIMQAWSGGANTGIFEAAQSLGDGYYAMGGSTGQFHMSDSIIASQVKNTDIVFYDMCKMALGGEWQSGMIDIGLADNAVGIKYAPDGRDEAIPQEIKDEVEKLRAAVISGEIVPPSTEEEYNAFLETLN